MARKRKRKAGPRKNPKRVAAGRKAAAARWGKKTRKKAGKKRRVSTDKVERIINRVLSQRFAVSVDGVKHHVGFTGHAKKAAKKTKRKGGRTAANLANLARGRAIRAANLASKGGSMFGPIFEPKKAGKGSVYAKRMANLAKARAVRSANIVARKAGIASWI